MAQGTIKKLIRDRGFGFIAAEDGREFFFHSSGLIEVDFEDLRKGDHVVFDIEETALGQKAVRIQRD